MDESGFIATIKNYLTIIGILWGILATWDKGVKTLRKVLAWGCIVAQQTKAACIRELKVLVGEDERPEDTLSPPELVRVTASDSLSMGLIEGYPAHRHRQLAAAYYYSDRSDISVPLNRQAVTSHAGRLLLSPPPLCINVFDTVSVDGSASCSATLS